MAKAKTYRVVYTPDEDGIRWNVRVDGEVHGTGCFSWGRSINEARSHIRDAISTAAEDDDAGAAAQLLEEFEVPAAESLSELRAERVKLDERLIALQSQVATHAERLDQRGFSRRDIGELVGISHQRVQQLLGASVVKPRRSAATKLAVAPRKPARKPAKRRSA